MAAEAGMVVVGAGPAGRAAASGLQKAGWQVRLLDMRPAAGAETRVAFHAERGLLWTLAGDAVERIPWQVVVLATGDLPALMPSASDDAWDQVGRVPDNRLAAALGCAHAYDPAQGWLLPVRDRNRMASVAGVFLPGAAGGPCDPATAAAEGEIVARAILSGAREPGPPAAVPTGGVPDDWAARATTIPDDTVVCPCMAASAHEVREAARAGADTLYHLGHWNLAGVGACRGRQCRVVLAALLESVTGRARAEVLTPPFEFPALEVPLAAFVQITPERPPAAPLQQDRGMLR